VATIKEIIDAYCAETNITSYSSYVNNTDPAAKQLLYLFKKAGDYLRNMPLLWPQLKRVYLFTTAEGQQRYQLPGDFYKLLLGTQWDTTNQWDLRGPISDFDSAARKYSVFNTTTRKAYQIKGATEYLYNTAPYNQRSSGSFVLDQPSENSTDVLAMGYISCNWIWPTTSWAASTAYTIGNIVVGNNNLYVATTNGTSGTTRPNIETGTVTDGSVVWKVYTEPYLISSSNTLLNDNDRCLFDEDLMIRGLAWAFELSKGLDNGEATMQFGNVAKGAYSRFEGVSKVNQSYIFKRGDFPNIPDGSW
jgi:hypothetical protein